VKLYVVLECSAEYESHSVKPVQAFVCEKLAEEYAKQRFYVGYKKAGTTFKVVEVPLAPEKTCGECEGWGSIPAYFLQGGGPTRQPCADCQSTGRVTVAITVVPKGAAT
jgi:hypothetical protein